LPLLSLRLSLSGKGGGWTRRVRTRPACHRATVTQKQIKSQSRMVPRLERMEWIAVVRTMEPLATEPALTLHDEERDTARLA
jgi:hypothetical protein